ncbi:MAG: outer membrane protein assembly factor BamE [Wolbachia endosymbiont of Menacanthus eurysternus]|nr:MAG: outer membrane protein assembly factor BamE [Wolbachia endosymbiont of Menacanthus eurysternus]
MRALIFFILLFTIGCVRTVYNHGILDVDVELWSKIKIGDDKEKVVRFLGFPTLVSKFNKNIWYYISYKIKQPNFLEKRKYSSKSMQILFNQDDRIADIKRIDVPEKFLDVFN